MLKKLMNDQKLLLKLLEPFYKESKPEHKFGQLNSCLTAISNETEECRRLLPWKPWKSYDKFNFDKSGFIEETVDLFHFLLEIWVWLGLSEEDIGAVYHHKKVINIKRWINDFPELRKHVGHDLLEEVKRIEREERGDKGK